jgi:adenylylsulfate kinase
MVIWISGITASGKTFLGKRLMNDLFQNEYNNVIHLDGDELRRRPGWVSGHSLEDRFKVLDMLVELIIEEQNKGKIVIVSTVSHLKKMRDYARERINNFNEIYLDCDALQCEKRDYKDFYKRAKLNSSTDAIYPGVTEKYQKSAMPELTLFTGIEDSELSAEKLLSFTLNKINDIKKSKSRRLKVK